MNGTLFGFRRIPGTLMLALTNLIASMLWFNQTIWNTSPVTQVPRDIAPLWVWTMAWLTSSLGLFFVVWLRMWNKPLILPKQKNPIDLLFMFHIFSLLSLFVWIVNSVGVLSDKFFGNLTLSPLAIALYVWVTFGQLAMIFGPLMRPRKIPWEIGSANDRHARKGDTSWSELLPPTSG